MILGTNGRAIAYGLGVSSRLWGHILAAAKPYRNIGPEPSHSQIRYFEDLRRGRGRLRKQRGVGCQKKAPAGEEQRALLTSEGAKEHPQPAGSPFIGRATLNHSTDPLVAT